MTPELSSFTTRHPQIAGPVRWASREKVVDWSCGQVDTCPQPDPRGVGETIAARLGGLRDDAVVVAALPFDGASGHPMLVAVEDQEEANRPSPDAAAPQKRQPIPAVRFERSMPDASGYATAVQRLRGLIAEGKVAKVVLARRFHHLLDEPIDVDALMDRLATRHPNTLRFRLPTPGGDFVGASPELLVATQGGCVRSHPLAGSAPRSIDLRDDELAAASLLASTKDLTEHAYVTEAITDILAPYCRSLVVPRQPSLVGTLTAWHLGTWIEGKLRDPDTPSALLAAELHPTPAVCGTPRPAARDLIAEIEGERGYYAGAVGWCDARGDGEWAVAIRSAEISATGLTAYAGAGIVADSRPESEVAETEIKVAALLDAIDVVAELSA